MAHRWDPVCPPVPLATPRFVGGPEGPSRGEARGRGWRRTSHGRYLPAHLPCTTPEQRIAEVAARLPDGAAITGWAALRLVGATFHDGLATDGSRPLPVPVMVGPRGGMRGPDVAVSFERFGPEDVIVLHGLPIAHPVRATFDAVRAARSEREAVVALEMAMIARLVSAEEVARYANARFRARRKHLVRVAAARASPFSRSPTETRLRLRCEDECGIGPLLVNPVLESRTGARLGEIDLFDPVAGMGVDYDGAEHRDVQRHSHDVLKDEALRNHGVEMVRVTSLQARSPALPSRVRTARARALFLADEERAWRVRPRPPAPPVRTPWLER